jgi:hypothetical protein
MKIIVFLSICLMTQGCASRAVRCASHLEPINAPAAKAAP